MYRIGICEDEPEIRTHLVSLCNEKLKSMGYPYEIKAFKCADDLWTQMTEGAESFHILLLDIQMPGMTGMELAKKLRSMGNRLSIVFISACQEYLLEGYGVQPLQYLIKPVSKEDLFHVIDLDYSLHHTSHTVTLENNKKQVLLDLDQIVYLESMNHDLYIHTLTETLSFQISLSKAMEVLPRDMFCQCHKSFVVNLQQIREVSRTKLLLKTGDTLSVGRNYSNSIQSALVRFLNQP